jgi:pyrrolysyl-tRNA synthetase-like protein
MTPDDACAGPVRLTATQAQRLKELGAGAEQVERTFADAPDRDATFKQTEDGLAREGRTHLQALRSDKRPPPLVALENALCSALSELGFVQVVTPHIVAADALRKMGIDHGHPLREQVFWLEDGRCLRPMLAPNLYTLMRRLGRLWRQPFGIFEVGTCFRRDSKGARHLNEFTMLNLVELGREEQTARARLEELAGIVMHTAGIEDYQLVGTTSEVYGEMLDVEVNGTEVCSAAVGPHPLDGNWGIVDPWVGLGFGLERLLMVRAGHANIERTGRSLAYVDGVRLNL